MKDQTIVEVKKEMITYFKGDPKRISHLLKVHSLASMIAIEENLREDEQYILEIAALVHDIGIKRAEEKYQKCNGKLQEQEGPKEAEIVLKKLNIEDRIIQRVSYLVGHHHTYHSIVGMDYQILVEADFLVNFYEDGVEEKGIVQAINNIFKTKAGIKIGKEIFNFDSI